MRHRVLLAWSSGKDSAWSLQTLRERHDVDVVGLITTHNEVTQRVEVHGVPLALVEAQAAAAGLTLWPVPIPWPCSNAIYEQRMRQMLELARASGITAIAFGDLYLADVRAYRERLLAATGIEPLFPLWGAQDETPSLAREMIAAGLRATVTCVDPAQLPPTFLGREFDMQFLADLPPHVDPCGERGEFHTFCHSGPMFATPIPFAISDVLTHTDQ